jgi:UDP-N-acetylmuramate--alanine ligase
LGRLHFAGIAGSGMSALAQYEAMRGGAVSGSDRAFDRRERGALRTAFERLGIAVVPQDGAGVDASCDAVVASTAVESDVADLARARALGIPIVHRSELLARFVAERRTVAVAGTSGKSTVVAMTFEILRAAGLDPSLLTGGDLRSLRRAGAVGNAWAGRGEVLVVEADESDGSLIRYAPAIAVVSNAAKDHQEVAETLALFATFRASARDAAVVGESEVLRPLSEGAIVFGFSPRATVRAEDVEVGARESAFRVGATRFTLPSVGRHEVGNALAAIAVAGVLGVSPEASAAVLASFSGVARRFEIVGEARGVTVVDDYAHNPAKIAAAIAAAKLGGPVIAVFQPHGFGPTRFLLGDLAAAFASSLGPADRLLLLDVYDAGGTARRDVSSEDLARAARALGRQAEVVPAAALPARVAASAAPGDVVLLMGARDPSLPERAAEILSAIAAGR